MSEKFSLKDELFNPVKVEYLASLIKNVYADFNDEKFIQNICDEFPKLELKQRIFYITENLEKYLPNDFEQALNIILKSLPKELDVNKTDDDFGDFIFAPFSHFVANNGLNDKHLGLSFQALSEMTKRFSCEDSIRFFINKYPKQSFEFMQKMAKSNNYHQRRLASEGLRPKLPWCVGLDFDYQQSVQILDLLYFDNTRYVVRSVANHLNDIAKIDANLVVKTLKKWQKNNKQTKQKEWDFLKKHALRTLVKKDNIQAFIFLGFSANPNVSVKNFHINNKALNLGDYLNFSFKISAKKEEKLMIDYRIIYPNPSLRYSEKVFKLKQLTVAKNTSIMIKKKHLFKLMSTKKLHSGSYQIQLKINGKIFIKDDFNLVQ